MKIMEEVLAFLQQHANEDHLSNMDHSIHEQSQQAAKRETFRSCVHFSFLFILTSGDKEAIQSLCLSSLCFDLVLFYLFIFYMSCKSFQTDFGIKQGEKVNTYRFMKQTKKKTTQQPFKLFEIAYPLIYQHIKVWRCEVTYLNQISVQ